MEDKIKEKITEKLSADSKFLSNSELKNTLVLEEDEYNINAVTAVVAEQTQADLTLNSSLVDGVHTDNFDGSNDKVINYVPSGGGKFTGVVHVYDEDRKYDLGSEDDPIKDSEILNYGQVVKVVSDLKGNPLWKWNPSEATSGTGTTSDKGYFPLEHGYEQAKIYGLNTVIGSVEDLPVFEAYATGTAHTTYVTPDSYDNAYIIYGSAYNDAYLNPAYSDIRDKITKLVFKGYTDEGKAVRIRAAEFTADQYQNGTEYGFYNLETVHINPGAYWIDNSAFKGCKRLTSIAIPNSITKIGTNVCNGCEGLTSLVLGSEITEIGAGAFANCTNLKSIAICSKNARITATTTKITEDAFYNCPELTKIYFKGSEADWASVIDKLAADHPLRSKTITFIAETAFPFLYICKGKGGANEDTSLTSNKIFLKVPGEALVEVSKGAARLERRDSKTSGNVDYFTYDVLAAVIAGINSRITALGSQALALPEKLNVYDTETKQTVVLDLPVNITSAEENKSVAVKEIVAPTVFELQGQVTKLTGGTYADRLVPSRFSDARILNYDFSGKTLKFSNIKAGTAVEVNTSVNYKITFNNGELIEGAVTTSSEVSEDDIVVLSNSGLLKVNNQEVSSSNLPVDVELSDNIGAVTELAIKLSTEAGYTVVSADKFDEYVCIDFEVENAEDKEYIDTVLKAKADEDNVNINTGYYRKASNEFTGNNASANTITISSSIPTSTTPGNIGDIMIVINTGDGEYK